jgi:hypothetical protein
LAAGITFYLCDKHYTAQYNQLQTEFANYKSDVKQIKDKDEEETIAKALREKEENKPVTETTMSDETTTIEAVQKESASDADVQMTNTVKPVVISYNGKTQELKTTTTESQNKTADNKVVITQQTQATLNVDDIVNREIANRIETDNKTIKDNKEKAAADLKKMNKEGNRKSGWCFIGGVLAGVAFL